MEYSETYTKPKILFVDDEKDIQKLFYHQFSDKFSIKTASSIEDVQSILETVIEKFDILVSDQNLAHSTGLEIVKLFRDKSPETIRIIVSGYRSFEQLVEAINDGEIYRFISKPWNQEELEQVLMLALRNRWLERQNVELVTDLRNLAQGLELRNIELKKQKQKLSVLLSILYDIQRETDILKKLDLVAKGIVKSKSFNRALIYLFDENMNVRAFQHAGLSSEDVEALKGRRPLTPKQRKTLLHERFKRGNSYFIPHDAEVDLIDNDQAIKSKIDYEIEGNWHPNDILLIPLYGEKETILGLISVDEPFTGLRPSEQELHIIELFAHEAGLIIEQDEVHHSMVNTHRLMEMQNMELRDKKMIFHSLLSLNYLTRKTIDINLILKSFKDYLIALFNADTFHLLLMPQNKKALYVKSAFLPVEETEGEEFFSEYKKLSIPVDDTFIMRLFLEKRPIFVNSFEDIGVLKSLYVDWQVQSIFSAPLVYNERILGIMAIGFQEQHNISLKLLEDFELFSNQLAGILFQEELIRNQEEDQRSRYLNTIQALAKAIEKKDPYTRDHCDKVREYSILLANNLGISKEQSQQLEIASILHDIGKIGINIGILRKESPLSPAEYNIIKKHPEIGEEILDSLPEFGKIRAIIRHHQERYDGNGYPDGLKGNEIPIEARILAIADAYDAMTSDRPYRKALSKEQAIAELKKYSGIQWDPIFVTKFIELLYKNLEIKSSSISVVQTINNETEHL